ncbi:MAG: gamma-glutamyltransferase [Acidisphaera sp.]|nr:gamma-glutamyltransferase [Acidisphaera sp.]
MVVTNHPLASAAGAEMLAGGGNAVDAAIAALFALTVVEPMMTGPLGGGLAHLRFPDGRHLVVDGMATVPRGARADMYRPTGVANEVENRENTVGVTSVCAPGNLFAWCDMLDRFGTVSLADAVQPAIRHAARGFLVTHYLADCIADAASDMRADRAIAARFLPGDRPLRAGERLVQAETAETLALIAREGPQTLRSGALADAVTSYFARNGGLIGRDDLAGFRVIDREPVRGPYRGWEIVGPPPPSSAGVHILQMLNILEGYDIARLGFGSAETMHLLAEALKIAFADRAVATADPDFVAVPVARLIDKTYAAERRRGIGERARAWSAGVLETAPSHTTHLTVADADGLVVAATQTINNTFGARVLIPELGLIPNNYMSNFDPHPGSIQSIEPGKRVPTSMAPMMALRDGRVAFALGLPGGLRIFGSAMQALVNLIDHGMTLQEAVEAPRLWTDGGPVETEPAFAASAVEALRERGHEVQNVPHVGGGMCAVGFADDGTMEGAACWRADGTPVGIAGGLARPGVRFWPDQPRAQ